MKHLILLLGILLTALTAAAENATYTIKAERDSTVKANIDGLDLGSRDVKHFVYEYPSVDPDGKPVTISGIVMIPAEIANGTTPCDGIVMYNHYTLGSPDQALSIDGRGLDLVSGMLANPLKPNYIVVASDYIGYGASIDHNAAYLCGDTNARNSLDGLLAAQQLLNDRQISQGKFLFSMGFSQGGTETMYAAKLTDTDDKYKHIRFDKCFSGGGPLDFENIYRAYVERDACDNVADVVFFLISNNENRHLGIDYKKLFKEPMASKVEEYLKTKDKSVISEIGVTSMDSISEVLQPAYMDMFSNESRALHEELKKIGVTQGWDNPDVTKQYYIEHSRHDNYVPVQSVRGIIDWMKGKNFKPSLVPGKTNLQTMMLVFKLKHQQSAIVWAIQTMAAIQFWPVLYYEGEQNRYYHDVVKDLNLMKVIKTLEGWGLDLRKLTSSSRQLQQEIETGIADGSIDVDGSISQLRSPRRPAGLEFLSQLTDFLAKLDLTLTDALQMLDDSGITMLDILEVVNYMQSPAAARDMSPATALEERIDGPLYLLRDYEQRLATWYMLGGLDVGYDSWGW